MKVKMKFRFVLCLLLFFFVSTNVVLATENKESNNKESHSKDNSKETNNTESKSMSTEQDKNLGSKKDSSKPKNAKDDKKNQSLQPFKNIELSGVGNIYIKKSEKQEFTVEGDQKVLPLVSVYVRENTLYIDLKNASEQAESTVKYYLQVKDLKSINAYTSSTIFIDEAFETDELTISVNNFGEANVFLNVKKFTGKIAGGGKIIARGRAIEQDISIQGAGEFQGGKLLGDNAQLNMQGSGMSQVNVSNGLSVAITGEGTVKYCGKPTITKNISGKGTVTPAEPDACSH